MRELQNVIERIAVELADANIAGRFTLGSDELRMIAPEVFERASSERDEALTLRERSRYVEADEIQAALARCGGDREAVCKMLGISKTTLWRRLNEKQ